jgi:hypothetical protein
VSGIGDWQRRDFLFHLESDIEVCQVSPGIRARTHTRRPLTGRNRGLKPAGSSSHRGRVAASGALRGPVASHRPRLDPLLGTRCETGLRF